MTTFDPTSLEDKLFTLLDVHRGDASEHVLRVQAAHIAFLIRNRFGPGATANRISVVLVVEPNRHGRTIMILFHCNNKKLEIIISASARGLRDVVSSLEGKVQQQVQNALRGQQR